MDSSPWELTGWKYLYNSTIATVASTAKIRNTPRVKSTSRVEFQQKKLWELSNLVEEHVYGSRGKLSARHVR